MVHSISILGSTGSIGRQTVAVAEHLGLNVRALTTNRNIQLAEEQARRLHPAFVAVTDETAARALRIALADTDIAVGSGENALCEAAVLSDTDAVVTAVSGMVGLKPTLAAIREKKRIALANKETLVCAGELVMEQAKKYGAEIIPVDSEHSAIFQCLMGNHDKSQIRRLLLTCSGGPFYGMDRAQLSGMKKEDALRHPNWKMGPKITIDCATLMNKGLEIIEAMRLYDLPLEQVTALIHRQSIVHSMVEFTDGAVMAQLGAPDMRIPIQYALTYPKRVPGVVPELDFAALKVLTFDVADDETFRCLAACKKAIKKGGLGPCAANGANEEAVRLFLEDKIGFLDIGRLVEAVVDSDSFGGDYTLSDVYECDRMAREFVRAHL